MGVMANNGSYGRRMTATYLVLVAMGIALSSAETGKFWHITDHHFDPTYLTEGASCHTDIPADQRGVFGNTLCDSPWRLINSSVYAMKAIDPDVDFIIWTGDSVFHTTDKPSGLSIGRNIQIITNITSLLVDAFPRVKVFPALGAHDYFPDSQYPDTDNALYREMQTLWSPWIDDSFFRTTFRKGGYYTKSIRPGLRVVSLNTNLYYTRNLLTVNFTDVIDPTDQFLWLNQTLMEARQNQEKVIIIGHISPGLKGYEGYLWMYEIYSHQLNTILSQHMESGVIVGMHFGHDHDDEFKIYYNKQGVPKVPVFIAPSVTPWRYMDSEGKLGREHFPGIRLVSYDRSTGSHLDIQQFYLNLTSANTDKTAHWELRYTATEVYGIPDVTAKSLSEAREQILQQPKTKAQNYFSRITLHAVDDVCDQDCVSSIYCGMGYFDIKGYSKCKSNLVSISTATRLRSFEFIIAAVISLVLCF